MQVIDPLVVGDVFGKWIEILQLPEAQRLQVIRGWRLAKLAQNHRPSVFWERLQIVAFPRRFLEVVEVVQHLRTVPRCVVSEYDRESYSCPLHRVAA